VIVLLLQDKEGTSEDVKQDTDKKDEPETSKDTETKEDATKTNICKACFTGFRNLLGNLVILPESRLRLIVFLNCFLAFATSITITYMVRLTD